MFSGELGCLGCLAFLFTLMVFLFFLKFWFVVALLVILVLVFNKHDFINKVKKFYIKIDVSRLERLIRNVITAIEKLTGKLIFAIIAVNLLKGIDLLPPERKEIRVLTNRRSNSMIKICFLHFS